MPKPAKTHLHDLKLKLTQGVFYLLFLAIILRLFYIQIIRHPQYIALAESQHWQRREIPAVRGRILSSDHYPLAANLKAYDLYLITKDFSTKEKNDSAIDELAKIFTSRGIWEIDPDLDTPEKIINEKKEQLKNSLLDENTHWLLTEKQIPEETKKVIEEKFNGVFFERHDRRYYPEGNLAAHVLGFVGANTAGEDQGYFGVEGYYNGDLAGKPGWISLEKDALGHPIPIGGYVISQAVNGRDLILTLNRELQFLLEKKLTEGVEKYGAKSGTFILLEPDSGKILAMGNIPTYRPDHRENTPNLAIAQNYEPGSVLKTVVMSAGLQEKVVAPSTTFECLGPLTIQSHQIRTWNNKYHGTESMTEILQHSCNVGAAWLSQQIGLKRYLKYVHAYQLGEKTGIDLEGEAAGIVKPAQDWQEIDLATAAFGQGISVTPIQLAAIFAAIANDGVKMKPFVVEKFKLNSQEITVQPKIAKKVLTRETALALQEMLQKVVEKGEFKWFVEQAGLDKFSLAGKTGTAQIPKEGHYDPHKTNVTFVGFTPVEQPKFVLLVKLEEPSTSTYSADTAVPLWLEMAKELVIYFGISPK
ncbi:hypothetical protein B5M47_02465 [candidate division CPR3 bacterium 4484_211]|uniref:Penicillin-binding protein transpeptidase domain-containing protein n=1 Tax=candidate division CPR3 bacterium 4484_211 TaxID=1968527 RepID=A0A1W9NXS3_UNCC3|nr:MAG: hypothetical protein B5M47_02465 [candidate division CPR3 bacterium 4484_211]